jgi:cell division protein FtsZ
MLSDSLFDPRATLKVIGVGGGGANAVDRMILARVQGVTFVAMNTDAQALAVSKAATRLQLGERLTSGLGSGGDPSVGEAAARESLSHIDAILEGSDMVFITAGMGGGTGTGAAPIVAQRAKEKGILTVGVVTKPFSFEGQRRMRQAEIGADKMREFVDTLITVPNSRLVELGDRRLTMTDAFGMADDVLRFGVQGISEIILRPGLINVDFADVRNVMANAGVALMGIGVAQGDNRAKVAAVQAANSPLLETNIEGAQRLLVNITSGPDFTIGEANDAMEYLLQFTVPEVADIIVGHVQRDEMEGAVSVTLLAAGMRSPLPRDWSSEPTRRRDSQPAVPDFFEIEGESQEAVPVGAPALDIPTFLRQQRERT